MILKIIKNVIGPLRGGNLMHSHKLLNQDLIQMLLWNSIVKRIKESSQKVLQLLEKTSIWEEHHYRHHFGKQHHFGHHFEHHIGKTIFLSNYYGKNHHEGLDFQQQCKQHGVLGTAYWHCYQILHINPKVMVGTSLLASHWESLWSSLWELYIKCNFHIKIQSQVL